MAVILGSAPPAAEQTVKECRQRVQETSSSRGVERQVDDEGAVHIVPGRFTSAFDIYISATGEVRFWGTAQQRFEFTKRMDQRAHAIRRDESNSPSRR